MPKHIYLGVPASKLLNVLNSLMLAIFCNSSIFLGSTLLSSNLIVNHALADNQFALNQTQIPHSDSASPNYTNEFIEPEIFIASNITVVPATIDLVK